MFSILGLGFLIGMQHALEADHVAAVASITTNVKSAKQAVRRGAFWGLGHSLALLAAGSVIILLDLDLPGSAAHWLEFAVGAMLVLLGGDVVRRLIIERVHFHIHRHGPSTVHLHAHSHRGESNHRQSSHDHTHSKSLSARAMAVGIMHGLAGTAALMLLVAGTIHNPVVGLFYICLFGAGSILGMAALSAIIAVPLHYSARSLTWAHNGLQAVIGVGTIMLGGYTMYSLGLA